MYYGPYGYAALPFYSALASVPVRGPEAKPDADARSRPTPSPIPGFRDPSNMSFQVPGYQRSRNYFR